MSLPHRLRRPLAAALLGAFAAGALAACGASSSASTSQTSGTQFQARLNLARCFRAHGINVPDPSSGGGPAGNGGVFRALRQYPQSQIQAATQACRQYFAQAFPRLNLTPAQRAARRQQLVKFAQCMRSHGVNIPDPTTTGGPGGGGFGIGREFRSIDRNSPVFQSALKACQSLRPQFGRGFGPGGPGGGVGPGGGPDGGGPGGGGGPGTAVTGKSA
jgi:hypothetical protein